MSTIENRVDALEKRVSNLDALLVGVEIKLDKFLKDVESLVDLIDSLQESTDRISEKLEALEKIVSPDDGK